MDGATLKLIGLSADRSLSLFWFHLQPIHRCRRAAVMGSVLGGAISMRHAAVAAATAAAAASNVMIQHR